MANVTFRMEDEQNDPFYSHENQVAIEKANKQILEGKVVIKTIEELEAYYEQ